MFVFRHLTRSALGIALRHSDSVVSRQFFRCSYVTSSNVFQKKDEDTTHTKLGNAEWAKRLSPEAYNITREKGTEPPYTGKYVYTTEKGTYSCVCCGANLFDSADKYESGTGWPSFTDCCRGEGGDAHVINRSDVSHGMVRTEVLCKRCDAHLGHVFEDGPGKTGLRYCINSAALVFNKST